MERVIDEVIVKQIPWWYKYWISSTGKVWVDSKRNRQARWIKISTEKKGRKVCWLYRDDGSARRFRVAQLVALTWIGPAPEGKPFVLHKDNDCTNDYFENLYYGDSPDNMRDRVEANGYANQPNGEEAGKAVLKNAQAREIFVRAQAGEDKKLLAKEFGVCYSTVVKISNRHYWKQVTQDL